MPFYLLQGFMVDLMHGLRGKGAKVLRIEPPVHQRSRFQYIGTSMDQAAKLKILFVLLLDTGMAPCLKEYHILKTPA